MIAGVLLLVYLFGALVLAGYRRFEVIENPEAMPACGHLRGWYVLSALWPIVLALIAVFAVVVVGGMLVIEPALTLFDREECWRR